MRDTPPPPEFPLDVTPPSTYLDAIHSAWGQLGIWDHLSYDAHGDLWINQLRVRDAIERFGSPLEIVDTTIIERRANEWMALSRAVASEVGYHGTLDYLYAGKANMTSEVVCAALRAGWGLETSAAQELANIGWLHARDLVPTGTRIVCNGFKLPATAQPDAVAATASGDGDAEAGAPAAGGVILPANKLSGDVRDDSYLERILELARAGWDIVPILDEGELPSFLAPGTPRMNVGFRLKFGPVQDAATLTGLVSRFGVGEDRLDSLMAEASRVPHLTVTTLHAMVGAAETISVERYVGSIGYAARVWARLRKSHESLNELNLGGGVPPLCEAYDHRALLRGLYGVVSAAAATEGVPPPKLTFEFGSLVVAESGFHVFRVIQQKVNHEAAKASTTWAIVDGGLMAAIPDMLFLGRPFRFLAATDALAPARPVRIGDVTCDSDGRYPPERFGPNAGVLLPRASDLHVVIEGVGAYQEILSGVRGAHHCGLLEAVELILETRADGEVHGRLMPRQHYVEAKRVLGYSLEAVEPLRAALAAAQSQSGLR